MTTADEPAPADPAHDERAQDEPAHDEPAHDEPAPGEPTPEQIAARAERADRATRSAMAGVLGLEALVVLLVPRAIRFTVGLGATRTTLLIALAVLLLVAAAGARRSWGIGAGTALHVPFILTGIWVVSMFFVGLVFACIWLYLLNLRHELVGTPGGVALLYS